MTMLKLTHLEYHKYDTYIIGMPILVDTTGIVITSIERTLSLNKGTISCSKIVFSNEDQFIVKETVDEIWKMIQEQKG